MQYGRAAPLDGRHGSIPLAMTASGACIIGKPLQPQAVFL